MLRRYTSCQWFAVHGGVPPHRVRFAHGIEEKAHALRRLQKLRYILAWSRRRDLDRSLHVEQPARGRISDDRAFLRKPWRDRHHNVVQLDMPRLAHPSELGEQSERDRCGEVGERRRCAVVTAQLLTFITQEFEPGEAGLLQLTGKRLRAEVKAEAIPGCGPLPLKRR